MVNLETSLTHPTLRNNQFSNELFKERNNLSKVISLDFVLGVKLPNKNTLIYWRIFLTFQLYEENFIFTHREIVALGEQSQNDFLIISGR